MADEVPAAIRQADLNIYKCATRAAQLQTAKPIIAYWCEYWVVNQILAKELHTKDGAVLEYTTRLMDKLERTKSEYENEPAITDDVAGQACVEQFAQETLDRAQRVVKANKVTAQTAGTFDAAATFFGLVHIWGAPDQETLQKIKYAKWNATRIFKAIKDGTDPNESNPRPEELPPKQEALDPSDPEVQSLGFAGAPQPRPVTVEDVPEHDGRRDSAGVSLPHSPVSAAPPSGEPTLPDIPSTAPGASHFGPEPPAQPGYFDPASLPRMPSPMSPPPPAGANDGATTVQPQAPEWVPTPSPPVSQSAFSPPPAQYQQPAPPPAFVSSPPPTAAVAPPPATGTPRPNYMNAAPSSHLASRPVIPPPTAPVATPGYGAPSYGTPQPPPPQAPPQRGFVPDDKDIAEAQKHARWAISALNFEDVPTAVKELRIALQSLGAS